METIPIHKTISISRAFLIDPIEVLEELRKKYGDRILFSWPLNTVLLFHPDDVSNVLLTMGSKVSKGTQTKEFRSIVGDSVFTTEGKDWQQKRKAIAPFFTASKISEFTQDFDGLIDREIDAWPLGEEVDMRHNLLQLMFRLSSHMFLGGLSSDKATEFEKILSFNENVLFERFTKPFKVPLWVPTAVHRRFSSGQKVLNDQVDDLIAKRKQAPDQGQDLITRMLTSGSFSDIDIRNELLTLFVAGFETTLTLLSWSLHLLSLHPEWVEILREDEFGGVRTENFAKEALRLYPPSPLLSRCAVETISKGGLDIPQGTNIVISQYMVQRDPRFWKRPEEFDPDRFNEPVIQGAYLPFSLGPRQCVGQHLAISEFKLIMRKLFTRLDIDIEKKQRLPRLGALLQVSEPVNAKMTTHKGSL